MPRSGLVQVLGEEPGQPFPGRARCWGRPRGSRRRHWPPRRLVALHSRLAWAGAWSKLSPSAGRGIGAHALLLAEFRRRGGQLIDAELRHVGQVRAGQAAADHLQGAAGGRRVAPRCSCQSASWCSATESCDGVVLGWSQISRMVCSASSEVVEVIGIEVRPASSSPRNRLRISPVHG